MPLDIFSTLELVEVINVQTTPDPYWLNLAYPNEMTFQTEEIMFDLIPDDRRLAPFVAPNVQGRVQRERGYTTKTFKPAYIKPKNVVDPSRAIARLPGERPLGELTLEQRYEAIIANLLQQQKNQITRRWDWMGARGVIDGAVTVVGEDYPSVTVDFGRDPRLTTTLAGTTAWTKTNYTSGTANPLKDIAEMRLLVNRLAHSSITRLTFGLDAWDAFTANPEVRDLLNQFFRGSQSDFTANLTDGTPYEFRGRIQGSNGIGLLELYTYSDQYEDETTGNATDYLDAGTVVGTGPGIRGQRCFGAIRDRRAQLAAASMFPKMWDEDDPSSTFLMTQSAPLMVPVQPNASFKMKVV